MSDSHTTLPPHQPASTTAAASRPPQRGSTLADLDRLPEPIQWAWPDWLPKGFVTILASEPGVGKSYLALRLAASIVDGRPWPDGAPCATTRGKVLWCESESGQRMNQQRALALGLDPAQIVYPLDHPLYNFQLTNQQHIDALTSHASRPDIAMVVLDSLTGLRTHGAEILKYFQLVPWLSEYAEVLRKPFLITSHLRQRLSAARTREPDLERLLGSHILARVARAIWVLDTPDPADPAHHRLSVVKSNLGSFPEPLGLIIDVQGFHVGPPPQDRPNDTELDRASNLFQDLLAGGPLPASQIMAQARAVGFSEATIRRAKKHLHLKSNKLPDHWTWELPPVIESHPPHSHDHLDHLALP